MKSGKAEVASFGRQESRLGLLSLLTMMVLVLSVGRTLYADELKLWHVESGQELHHSNADDHTQAIEWLGFKDTNVAKFVETYPPDQKLFQFIEGVKEAELDAIQNGKLDDFREKVKPALLKEFPETLKAGLKDPKLKTRMRLARKLIEALIGPDKEKADKAKKRLEAGDLEEKLLKDELKLKDLKEAFGLTDEKPKKKEEVKTESQKTKDGESELDKRFAAFNEQLEKNNKSLADRLADIEKRTAEALARAVTPAVKTEARQPQPLPPPTPKVGEVDDSALKAKAQELCDKLAVIKKSNDDAIQRLHDQVTQAQKNIQDQLAAVGALAPKFNPQGNVQDQVPSVSDLFANLLNPRRDEVLPQNNAQQLFPQTQQAAVQPDPEPVAPPQAPGQLPPPMDPNAMNQNGMFPWWLMQQPQVATTQPVVNLGGMPSTNDFSDALGDVQGVSADNENPALIADQLGPNAGLPDLLRAKWDLVGRLQNVKTARQNALDQAREIKAQVAEYDKQAREKLFEDNPSLKRELDNRTSAYQAAQQKQQQAQTMMMMAQQNPSMKNMVPMMMMQAQQAIQQAKQSLDQINSTIDQATNGINGKLKGLKQMASQFSQEATKLKSQEGTLTQKLNSIQQTVSTTVAMMMQPPPQQNAQQQQPFNVNNGSRAQSFGGGSAGGPRSQSQPSIPQRSGANMNGSMRGPLGAMGPNAMSAGLGQ